VGGNRPVAAPRRHSRPERGAFRTVKVKRRRSAAQRKRRRKRAHRSCRAAWLRDGCATRARCPGCAARRCCAATTRLLALLLRRHRHKSVAGRCDGSAQVASTALLALRAHARGTARQRPHAACESNNSGTQARCDASAQRHARKDDQSQLLLVGVLFITPTARARGPPAGRRGWLLREALLAEGAAEAPACVAARRLVRLASGGLLGHPQLVNGRIGVALHAWAQRAGGVSALGE
jgi:hypothetical protein